MEDELIKVPKDLLEELASEYQAKIAWFMEAYKGYYDEVGSRYNKDYNYYVDNFNIAADLLGWDKMGRIE
ncbi:hypothetical protein [Providencia rettgeri]|uniref:Uncharacterized protein n=1 Tax=Providencia rettgeri TaxID=587 RepID=A0AAE3CX52_PRORE|nr:hypothetical protein [Providencia rettgeri]MBW3117872.1 hypothetical protein [Providencia rettgeri]NHN54030.1 hypothetical protein [Providencia rettgeri]